MSTQCNAEQLEFACAERRRVVMAFDAGQLSPLALRIVSTGHLAYPTRSLQDL